MPNRESVPIYVCMFYNDSFGLGMKIMQVFISLTGSCSRHGLLVLKITVQSVSDYPRSIERASESNLQTNWDGEAIV